MAPTHCHTRTPPPQSPHTSFTDQGRCCAVNKRGKKQCANKSMSGSRFCKTHYDLINANPWSSTNW